MVHLAKSMTLSRKLEGPERDGKPARSLLLFHGLHLKKCEPTMKEYAKTESKCMRKLLLSKFEATSIDSKEAHDCCVVCHSKCQCLGQGCQVDLLKVIKEAPKNLKQKKTRNVDPTQKEELRELLDDYQEELKKWCCGYVLSSESTTGFSKSLTNSVLKTCKYIFSVDDVIDLNPVFSKRHANDILHMIRDVFEDFEVHEPSDLENQDFFPMMPIWNMEEFMKNREALMRTTLWLLTALSCQELWSLTKEQ